jgi:hypothetical protein
MYTCTYTLATQGYLRHWQKRYLQRHTSTQRAQHCKNLQRTQPLAGRHRTRMEMTVHGIAYLPGGPAVATTPRELSASLAVSPPWHGLHVWWTVGRYAYHPCTKLLACMRAEFLFVFFVSLIQMLICMLCWMRLNFLKNTAATFDLWHICIKRPGRLSINLPSTCHLPLLHIDNSAKILIPFEIIFQKHVRDARAYLLVC